MMPSCARRRRCAVYLMEELFIVLKTAPPDVTNEVADYLITKRLQHSRPLVKSKTLKVIRVSARLVERW